MSTCAHVYEPRDGYAASCSWGPGDHIHQPVCDNGQQDRHHEYQPNHEHRFVTVCRDCLVERETLGS